MIAIGDLGPADRHRVVASRFGEVAAAVPDWSSQTPVAEWRAADVVDHLLTWFPEFLGAGGVTLAPVSTDDRAAAWRERSDEVQGLLDGPGAATEFTHPMIGTLPLAAAVDQFYSTDVFMHTWDLAWAAGVEHGLDPEFAGQVRAGMEPMEEMLRGSGQYGPAVPVPVDADPVARLMGFIGRDPNG